MFGTCTTFWTFLRYQKILIMHDSWCNCHPTELENNELQGETLYSRCRNVRNVAVSQWSQFQISLALLLRNVVRMIKRLTVGLIVNL